AVRLIDSSGGPVTSGELVDKSILNEDYDQTGVYSDRDNQVVLVISAIGKNTPPYVDDLRDDLEVTERGEPIRIGEGSTVGDRELLSIPDIDWEDFSITIRRQGGADADDVFSYWNGSEFVDIRAGDQLIYNGVVVGVVTKNDGGEVTLTFNDNADQASVSAILGNIGYSISSHNPPESVTLEYVLNDGNYDDRQGKGGELYGYAYQVIKVIPVPEDPIAEDNVNYIQLDEDRDGEADGNILWNAYDPDGTPVHVIDPDTLEGEYGYLTIDKDGNYVYVVNSNHPDVLALQPGEQLVDTIVYRVGDGNDGYPATATLTIIIETTVTRTTLPDTDENLHDTGDDVWYDDANNTFRSLWSTEKRLSGMDHLHLADMSVDKPVVPAVQHANAISDWEIQSALASLQQWGVNPSVLEKLLRAGILEGVDLVGVSLQVVPADSFLSTSIRRGLLEGGIEGPIASLRAVLADGSTLPYWIYFDAEHGTLTVTPPDGTAGEYAVVIVAEGETGDMAAEAVVFSVAVTPDDKPEVLPSRPVESSTERDALEMDWELNQDYWDPGMIREVGKTDLRGAISLAGQIAGIGTYGIARRAKRLETAAVAACRSRGRRRQ
ncbi:MAG: VCBS domain-containing protein, partial [Planctomycetes bacterium]|nr:VCBS domain-containing protein [Planctomycetota bacterium]